MFVFLSKIILYSVNKTQLLIKREQQKKYKGDNDDSMTEDRKYQKSHFSYLRYDFIIAT